MSLVRYGVMVMTLMTAAIVVDPVEADPPETNYDESKVPAYVLPELLTCTDGTKVVDAEGWQTRRRPELLESFRSQMYGRSPKRPAKVTAEAVEIDRAALDGLATRKQFALRVAPDAPPIHVLLYVPNDAPKPAPMFLGINFDGNHTVDADPGVRLVAARTKESDRPALPDESTRGRSASRWPLRMILNRGYAAATFARGDVEPDFPDGWRHGVRGYYLRQSGKQAFADDDWGAVAAWAWSLSVVLDALQSDADVDARRTIVHGHSRLGKAALWAGAEDERFAAVISNNSGEAGAATARRRYGETTEVINTRFPHWFCRNFHGYSQRVDELPFDQHELLALAVPRPLYVASAEEDRWADPRGEFLSLLHAQPAYALFRRATLGVAEPPPVDTPVGDVTAYHVRRGKHDVTEYDWRQYLDFADRTVRRSSR